MEGCEMRKCCLIVYNLYVVLSVVAYRMPCLSWRSLYCTKSLLILLILLKSHIQYYGSNVCISDRCACSVVYVFGP